MVPLKLAEMLLFREFMTPETNPPARNPGAGSGWLSGVGVKRTVFLLTGIG